MPTAAIDMTESVNNASDIHSHTQMGKEPIQSHLETEIMPESTSWSTTNATISLSIKQPLSPKITTSTSYQSSSTTADLSTDTKDKDNSNTTEQSDTSKSSISTLSELPLTSSNPAIANPSQCTTQAIMEEQAVSHTNNINSTMDDINNVDNDLLTDDKIASNLDDSVQEEDSNIITTLANLASLSPTDQIFQQTAAIGINSLPNEIIDCQLFDEFSVTANATLNGSTSLSQEELIALAADDNDKKSNLTLIQAQQQSIDKNVSNSNPKAGNQSGPTSTKTNFTLQQLMSTKASNQKLLAERLSLSSIETKDIKLYANNLSALLINTKKTPDVKQQTQPVDAVKTTTSTSTNYDHISTKTSDKGLYENNSTKTTSSTSKFTSTPKVPPSKNRSKSTKTGTSSKPLNQGKKRPPPTAAAKQAKRAARITTALGVDQIFVESPQMKPFESFENACRELLRYHVYYEPIPKEDDVTKFDEAYECTSEQTLQKIQRMYNKFTRLLYEESKSYAPSAERVLMDRIFLADERKDFEEIKKESMGKFAESAGTVLATLSTSGAVSDSVPESAETKADSVNDKV
ncbi:GLTSCR1-like protein [Trichoplax sp. H2]|nr:GLTSCR1-like protein [Trichoplax sp. H2]|eukprot:RDD41780.1 GLTSCR1-like protein [Trichoplax sp. H2]